MRRRYTTPDERKLRHIIEDPALREWFENNKDNLPIKKMNAPKQLKAQLMEIENGKT